MTDQLDYTASIKSKRLKNTGMTEDVIRQLHGRPGARVMAVVELCVDDAHNKHDAPNHVDFSIEQVVPFLKDNEEAFLRQMTASSKRERDLSSPDGQLTIETPEDLEPSVEDVIAAQRAHAAEEPHEFVPDDEHPENCFTCGAAKSEDVHTTIEEPADEHAGDLEVVGT
jgi:hypothetical protein